jgi:hypothetical protein
MPWGQSKRPLARLLAFGGGAALLALPMLAYYTVAFGSPFSTGSREIGHFALANIPANILNMGQGLFASPEFLWLVPLLLWGISSQWRTDRHKLIGLGLAVLILIAFHLPYKLLSIRHLLPIFPILAFWSAAGFVDLLRRLQLKSRPRYWPFLAVGVMLVLLLIRERQTLFLAANPYFATYGYLTSEQRQSFDTLADLTPPEAIIATSLNGGAIVLYAERTIVRPGDWSNADWLTFVEKIAPSERPLYLLVDGVKMEAPLAAIQARYSLSEEAVLPMTYFFLDGTGVAESVSLYRVSLE